MQVWAHPHTGLQTVSWLVEGEIEHRDSLGSQAMVRPGELQHHDRRPRHRAQRDLPAGQAARRCTACSCGWRCPTTIRDGAPRFDSLHATCLISTGDGVRGKVLIGELDGVPSPAISFTRRWSAPT